MKALVRNRGETVTEKDNIAGIEWITGTPLTNVNWCGGPYRLVDNYAPREDGRESYEEIVEPEQIKVEDENDYVIIDGKRYNKEELRSLLK